MEQKIQQVVREAFKKAYINKILKESTESLASNMSPEELKMAEHIYPLWIGNKLKNLKIEYGSKSIPDKVFNYLVEKAAEEYKQTKDERIQGKISVLFYPKEKSKAFNSLFSEKDSRVARAIIGSLKKRFGNRWQEEVEDLAFNAFTRGIQEKFDEIINKYTYDSPTGIGALFMNSLQLAAMEIAKGSASVRKGADIEGGIFSLDDPISIRGGTRKEKVGDSDDAGSDALGGLDDSPIEVPEEETYYDDEAEKMTEMFAAFADEAVKLPNIANKETHTNLLQKFFKDRKSYEEILAEDPDLYPGKTPSDLSATMINMLKNNLIPVSYKVARRFGFPRTWLERIMESKDLKNIQKLFKQILPEPEGADYPKEKEKVWDPMLEINEEEVLKEVYKRLGITK